MVSEYLGAGRITWEQAVLALDKHHLVPDVLAYMGLKGISRGDESTNALGVSSKIAVS
jgi:hypothetical protein